jgi:hypothetical protein
MAGKGCKYREIPLNQDARQAFFDLELKKPMLVQILLFLKVSVVLYHLVEFNLC